MNNLYNNLPKNSVIMMHSSLSSIGKEIEIDQFLENIISEIGEGATLVMPTFNFSFDTTRVFDLNNTPSQNGILTEKFRLHLDVKRTNNPIQSLAIYGKNQQRYISSVCDTTFGKSSVFDMMYNDDAYIVLLGVDYNKVSFYHYLEEKYKVPYRFWKTFDGEIVNNNKKESISFKMYVRDLQYMPNINHYGLLLEERGLVNKFYFYNSIVRIFKFKDMYELLKKDIFRDPYCLVNTDRNFWEIKTSK